MSDNNKNNGNGIKIRVSNPIKLFIWALGLVFAGALVYFNVGKNTDEIKTNKSDIKDVNVSVQNHEVRITSVENWQKDQEKQYHQIMKGIKGISDKIPEN